MDYKAIRLELDGPIAVITLDRPEVLNAFNYDMKYNLLDALDKVEQDKNVRALIVTGEGRAFCSGADLSSGGNESFLENRADAARRPDGTIDYDHPAIIEGTGELALRLFHYTKPIIAAINGPSAGFGTSFPLPMDIRIASDTATFGFVFARRGMVTECAASWFLPRLVGVSTALEWCYTGRKVGAQEAREAGLVHKVVPQGEALPAAKVLAMEIAQNSAPVSVTLIRQMFWRGLGIDHPMEAHRIESWGAYHRSRGPDAAEGVRSFFEKRPPDFTQSVPDDLPDFYPWWDDSRYARPKD